MAQSEKLSRKRQAQTNEKEKIEELFCLIQYIKCSSFSVVKYSSVTLDVDDCKKGFVVDRNKKAYKVLVLAVGNESKIEKKAKKYRQNRAIETTDNDDEPLALPHSASVSDIESDKSLSEPETRHKKPKQIELSSSSDSEHSPVVKNKRRMVYYDEFELVKKQYTELVAKLDLAAHSVPNTDEFVYEGKNLINDFHGRTPTKWALHCVAHLFTKDELKKNVLEHSNRTERGILSPTRVKLLKDAMKNKYQFDVEKFEKHWLLTIRAVNGKGRGIKLGESLVEKIRNGLNLNKS